MSCLSRLPIYVWLLVSSPLSDQQALEFQVRKRTTLSVIRLPHGDMRIIALIALITAGLTSCDFWEVDNCLDQGGSWNYQAKECDLDKNHPSE